MWKDVEADEAVLRKCVEKSADGEEKMNWEQWGGVVQRGLPKTLALMKLNASLTKTRAPGPGAIKKTDWKPFAAKHLANRHVILHMDSARS